MKTFTTVGAVLGAVSMLLSPQVTAVLSGAQVFWLLLVALVCALLGESIIPAIRGQAKTSSAETPNDAQQPKEE